MDKIDKLAEFEDYIANYKFRIVTQKMLAEEYNVCEHTIHYLLKRRTWKN